MKGHRELIGRAVSGAIDESGKLELVGGRAAVVEDDGGRGHIDDPEERSGRRVGTAPTKAEGIRTPPESTLSVAPRSQSSGRRRWLMGAGALGIVLGALMFWGALGGSKSVEGSGSGDVQGPPANGLDIEAEAESTEAENTSASAQEPQEPQGVPAEPAGLEAAAEAPAPEIAHAPPEAATAPFRPAPAKRPGRRPRAPMTAMDPAPAARGTGYLSLDSMPWANVSLGGQSLGSTPLLRRPLPEGNHVLTLDNPEEGLSMTYRVTVVAGETTTRRVGLR
ncbi:MAG: PEGA domain-containing protein [Deltaproteobacteria bacterium]|nr:PEGA domain-containing protein [Deltaproteobacteria bacterium]